MSNFDRPRNRFSPGIVDYNGDISAHYQSARALSFETADAWYAVLQPLLRPLPLPTIVDVGCGTGRFSALFAERFDARVIGVEPALGMLRVAASSQRLDTLLYMAGRAESLPLRDLSCDIAWLSQVIHHIADRQACAEELRRVIRPRGSVLIRGAFGDRLDGFPTFFHFFPGARKIVAEFPALGEVISHFARAGFALERLQTVQQKSCGSLRELAERTRLRADSTLALLPDDEFESCQANLDLAAEQESQPTPVLETLDLVVLGRS